MLASWVRREGLVGHLNVFKCLLEGMKLGTTLLSLVPTGRVRRQHKFRKIPSKQNGLFLLL